MNDRASLFTFLPRRKVRFLGGEGEEIAWFWRDRQLTPWRQWEWT